MTKAIRLADEVGHDRVIHPNVQRALTIEDPRYLVVDSFRDLKDAELADAAVMLSACVTLTPGGMRTTASSNDHVCAHIQCVPIDALPDLPGQCTQSTKPTLSHHPRFGRGWR